MIKNTLVISRQFYNSVNKQENLSVIKSYGYEDAHEFFAGICDRLNLEYNFTNLNGYRFQNALEYREFSMYSAFVEGDVSPYNKIILSFTPIITKLGNTNIVQEVMPMVCKRMEMDINFLLNKNIKKICVLTSKFNSKNEISQDYNTLQMNVNSLNTINFDVIAFFPVKYLSMDTRFNSLTEYLDMAKYLQKKNSANDQFEYFELKKSILFGKCLASQIKGQWQKTFVFKFFTAIFSGKNDFYYDIEGVLKHGIIDNQLKNLKNFIDYINLSNVDFNLSIKVPADDLIEGTDDISNIDDTSRLPQQGINKSGRQRYKTQRKIRDQVIENYNYLCDCHDQKHFYFESSDSFNNYVEGHHVIPMNRQGDYWNDKKVNLDVFSNIVPLCPNCHSQIHLGSRRARLDILSEIFIRNEAKLLRVDRELDLAKLVSYYNIGLEDEEARYLIANARIKVNKKEIGQI